MKNMFLSICIFCFILGCASGIKLPNPSKPAGVSSEYEDEKIHEAVNLHDQARYKEAIKIYHDILTRNPDNVTAIYELAYSCFQSGQVEKSLEHALEGLSYESEYIGGFYMMAANNLDIMGEPEDAVKAYHKAIEYSPNESMLYYNLAVTYSGMGKPEEAESNFIKGIQLNPNHSSGHIALGEIYFKRGDHIPAILLMCRFLTLEPNSNRSRKALQYLGQALGTGVEQQDSQHINIFAMPLADANESQYGMMGLTLQLVRATRYIEENKNNPEIENRLNELSTLIEIIDKDKISKGTDFLEKYLLSYFADIHDVNMEEAMVYYIHQSFEDDSTKQWIKENWPKLQEFERWNIDYNAQ